jgi:hypothetical protein
MKHNTSENPVKLYCGAWAQMLILLTPFPDVSSFLMNDSKMAAQKEDKMSQKPPKTERK